ncbi:MAG: response regulator transcription factor [Anaerolineaceae bacterium]|nr:response regulator transcription factor [Anaerolineaceae bacterium]
MNERILVVDDERKILRLAKDYLENSQFQVLTAEDGNSALHIARTQKVDLIVLDLNLPERDGLDVCRILRRESDVPIIMLTARVDETDRLIGLELGADDYITKPFSPRELVARVKVVLRRVQGGIRKPGLITAGDLIVDLEGYQITINQEPISLSRTEFELLAYLAQYPGRTFTREQLLDHLHGYSDTAYSRSIDAHIKNLRKKIEPVPSNPEYVLTVFGVGYKFNDQNL